MNFSQALELLKSHKSIKRETWPNDVFISKYVDTDVFLINSGGKKGDIEDISVFNIMADDWEEVKDEQSEDTKI